MQPRKRDCPDLASGRKIIKLQNLKTLCFQEERLTFSVSVLTDGIDFSKPVWVVRTRKRMYRPGRSAGIVVKRRKGNCPLSERSDRKPPGHSCVRAVQPRRTHSTGLAPYRCVPIVPKGLFALV